MIIQTEINKIEYTVDIINADNFSFKPNSENKSIRSIIESVVWQSIVEPKSPQYRVNKSSRRRSYNKGI